MHRQLLTMDMMLQFMDPGLYKHLESTESFNLFFCFRWLLVWFKREFKWDDLLSLWDVLYTDHLSTQFHLFVALAILDQHRNVIIDHLKHFDEILKVKTDAICTMGNLQNTNRQPIVYQWSCLDYWLGRNTAKSRDSVPSIQAAGWSCRQ